MAASPREVLLAIELQEPAIQRAFLVEIRRIVGDAKVTQIERLIVTGRVDQIAVVLGITTAAFTELVETIRAAYVAGGIFEVAQLPVIRRGPGGTLRFRFDVRNVRAEAWLRNHSSEFVTGIVDDQRELIRQVVAEGTQLGRNPRSTALDLVGRIGATGRRTGGIIGLTRQQAEFVLNARRELLSGDLAQMRNYLGRARRDARFDGIVNRAIREGRAVSSADVDRMAARYADRLLLLRGETIARTEALAAFNAARDETYAQAIDQGVRPENVTKKWRTAGDGRVRDAHAAMSGQKRPFDQPFRSPTGALLRHPGDTSLGAGAADIANCRCVSQVHIDFIAQQLG